MKQHLLLCWVLCWWFYAALEPVTSDGVNSTLFSTSTNSTMNTTSTVPIFAVTNSTIRYSIWGTTMLDGNTTKPATTNVISKQASFPSKNSFWDNLGSFRKNLSNLFPATTKAPTTPKESRSNPLLSSLLSWPSPLNKPGMSASSFNTKLTTPKTHTEAGKWTWPSKTDQSPLSSLASLSSLLTSANNASTQGRIVLPSGDKHAGGSSHHPSYHHHHNSHYYPHDNYNKPPHGFASPYGAHKHEPHYSHEYGIESHGYGPYDHGHRHSYEEHYTHSLYQPHLPPHPPDGALAPVYEPHAKVSVSADFVELKCNVYGDALPHIRWVKLAGKGPHGHILFTTIAEGGHVLLDHYHYAVRTDGRSSRLIIRDPDPHVHYGTYQCQVMIAGNYNHVTNDDFVVGRPY